MSDDLRHQVADQLGFNPSETGAVYYGPCPRCKNEAQLAETGFDCTTCGWAASLEEIERESTRQYRLVTVAGLENRQAPGYTLNPTLPRASVVGLFSPPGDGKSFVALDWSAQTASGVPGALMQPGQQGPVVYVSAEGASGLGARIAAWRDYYNVDAAKLDKLYFVLDAVQLMDETQVWRFVRDVREAIGEPPILVVFDTLARCLVGGDENSAKDMGLAIRGADIIRRELGCTVLLIHHANKNGDSERGSTALRGAVDLLISLKKQDGCITLKAEKSKDAPPFPDIELALRSHLDSAVVTLNPTVRVMGMNLTAAELSTLRSLSQAALSEGLTVSKWEEVSGTPTGSFYRHRKALYDGGFVERTGEGRGAMYRVSRKGEQLLTPTLSSHSQPVRSEWKLSLPITAPLLERAVSESDGSDSEYLQAERDGMAEGTP